MKDLDELKTRLGQGQSFRFLFFWGHTAKGTSLGKECLSQWYEAQFTVEGTRYQTAEHYMMAAKARLFGDAEHLAEILKAESPGAAKALGRKVRGYEDRLWSARRFDAVVEANLAKFRQNPALRDFLLGTHDKVLVEASPRDRIWGIGMSQNNEAAGDPFRWRGQNLLGFALMQARAELD